jgi:hypothetical protein
MHAEPDLDFFLVTAMEWAAVRADAPPGSRAYTVATAITRAAACCHVLFQQGRHTSVMRQLRDVCDDVLGVHFPAGVGFRPKTDAAQTLAVASDLFHRLRLAVDPTSWTGAA